MSNHQKMYESDFYRRNLPHWQPHNAEYFVTFRLSGSLPSIVIDQLKRERRQINDVQEGSSDLDTVSKKNRRRQIFKKYEKALDSSDFGPTWLANSDIANIIEEALLYRDKKEYDLFAFCIMSNHVHMIFQLLDDALSKTEFPVTNILRKLKSFTGLKANQKLERTGAFWHSESYDHVIRDQNELENTIRYVLNNPVKIGLVDNWKDWQYNYCKPIILDTLF